jgi:hypothetical protein
MASYVKFQDFVEALGLGEHNLNTDTLKVYLSNATPDAAADADKTDLAEITNENGYTAPEDIQNTYSESGGTGTLAAVDVVITASGGTVGPFRYAVIYNDTHATDGLVCYFDYGSSITLQDGESFTVDFGASLLTIA